MYRDATSAAGTPIAKPATPKAEHLPQCEAQDERTRGAERHPDADLGRVPRHRVADGTVEPGARDHEREQRERIAQAREQISRLIVRSVFAAWVLIELTPACGFSSRTMVRSVSA